MDATSMRVLALSIVAAGDRLKADHGEWHRVFYELKQEGFAPEIFSELRFSKPSGGRAYSEELEELLFTLTLADLAGRENPDFEVLEIKNAARTQIQGSYRDVGERYADTIERISGNVRRELTA